MHNFKSSGAKANLLVPWLTYFPKQASDHLTVASKTYVLRSNHVWDQYLITSDTDIMRVLYFVIEYK